MNFNFSHQPEYRLNGDLTEEVINLYGTLVQFVFMDKIQEWGEHHNNNPENSVFGNFKTLKSSSGFNTDYKFYVLLNEAEGFNAGLGSVFNSFGAINDDSVQVLVSPKSLTFLSIDDIIHPKELVSNVLIFPNGKVMEITDCQYHSAGINNKFLYSDLSTCFTLSLKSHSFDAGATQYAIPDSSPLRIDGVNEFFNKRQIKKDLTEDFASADILKIDPKTLGYSIKSSKIDDVFGIS